MWKGDWEREIQAQLTVRLLLPLSSDGKGISCLLILLQFSNRLVVALSFGLVVELCLLGVVKSVDANATIRKNRASPSMRKPFDPFTSCPIQRCVEFHGDSQSEPQQHRASFGGKQSCLTESILRS